MTDKKINEASYSNGKAAFYDADVVNVKRLISELPSKEEKAKLSSELDGIMNLIHRSEGSPSAYETAERSYKDFKAKVRYMRPQHVPNAPATPAPTAPVAKAPRVMPVRKAKSSAEKDRAFINNRIAGLEKQLTILADTPDVLVAKSQLEKLKQAYATSNEDDLLKFIQTEFGPVSNEINKVVIANKGNVKMPTQQSPAKGPEGIKRFASPSPAKKELTPDEFLAAHPELADDPSMMESILKEGASRTLMKTISGKTGLPTAQLEQFWELAVQKNSKKSQDKDTAFWSGVMKEFQNLIDKVDIEEARNIMETREKYREAAGKFLNDIAEDNYVGAQESFKTMVDSRLNDNIARQAEAYCQNVLSKEAKKIANDQ
jgi:hypothetical protein